LHFNLLSLDNGNQNSFSQVVIIEYSKVNASVPICFDKKITCWYCLCF